MAQRESFIRPPVVVVAMAPGTWLDRAIASVLEPRGFRVLSVSGGRELLHRVPELHPDVILIDADLPDQDSVAVCRALRQDRAAWKLPVVMVTTTPTTKQQRVAALEAGAWDYLSALLSVEELTLKLDLMARVKLEMDRALDESVVDPASGLYTVRGLERRARELTNDAFRRHAPLACVAIGIELQDRRALPATRAAAPPMAIGYAAEILLTRGRTSDAVGCAATGEFTLLAPGTAPAGALQMARRLSQAIETAEPRPARLPPLRVRAGYEAVADAHATPIEPTGLLQHAGVALEQARATGNGEHIRAYRA